MGFCTEMIVFLFGGPDSGQKIMKGGGTFRFVTKDR
jgi:hypothetical protein